MATLEVTGLCAYRIQRVIDAHDDPDDHMPGKLDSPTDVIMWALDAAVEQGWMEPDGHLLGTDEYFEPPEGGNTDG